MYYGFSAGRKVTYSLQNCATVETLLPNFTTKHYCRKSPLTLTLPGLGVKMDNVAVSRRKYNRGNKENTQPTDGGTAFIKSDKKSTAPFQLKSNKKDEVLAKNGLLQAKSKKADTKLSSEDLKKVNTVQRVGREAVVATDVKLRQTHSQRFLTEQAVKDKKTLAEGSKPPAAVPSAKSAPGMYKGKIVQSKIGSIWKSGATVSVADSKTSAPKTESQRVGNVTKIRSKSVADLPGRGTQKPAQTRSKSVLDRPAQVSKPAVSGHRPAGFYSARPPARTLPATLTSTSSRDTNVAFTKRGGTKNSKPSIQVTDKVNKPPVSSTVSQYRFTMETAEERRAKLAEWLASKGKTFKRPAMTTVAPSTLKTKVCAKPEADLIPQSQPAAQCEPEPRPSVETYKQDSAAALCADTQGADSTTHSQTPVIMNTTLDLLENSDADLPVDPQERVDDIVVNLCDAMEAMATLSRCNDELSQVADECNDVDVEESKPKDESKTEEPKNEMLEEVSEQPTAEQVKDEVKESDDQEEESDDEEVEGNEHVMETTPEIKDASVVKYSVKTTPYLQSVKKTIVDEASTSASRKKSNIKDLKFLTPVRRSCRIQRISTCLPTMLLDHDPCVSSLAELVKLDDDPNAYIYRKNPSLLENLPDQTQP